MASISSARANIFMPITVVLRRSRLFRSATMPARSSFSSLVAACCMNRHSLNGRLTAACGLSLDPSRNIRRPRRVRLTSTEWFGEGTIAAPTPTRSLLMTHHHLHSSPETCHWGFFEAKLKPVLTIASGDEVTIDTISGGPDVVPDRSRFHILPELDEVHAKSERMLPGHILTGPIAVRDAEPGDVLEVEILDVQLRQDWGWSLIRPLSGTLPDDFHETRLLNIPLDRERMVGRLPWGLDLPLKPFFGVMGVAPPP